MESLLEATRGKFEKISFPNGEFTVDTEALPERFKDFWKLFVDKWEKGNRQALSDFIDSNTTVIDLGAWVGPLTLMSAALGAKHVYAFEPDKRAYKFLEKNYSANRELQDRITLSDSAIAEMDGEIGIGPLSGRSFGDSTTSIEGTNLFPVSAISVDTMSKKCHLDAANKICIKIDIEGSEKYVLQDIVDMIADTDKPFLIIVEVHPYHFSVEDSKKVEDAITKLISISNRHSFKQRRRVGEVQIYPNVETEWRSELYHPNGLFDMTFERE